MLLRMIALLVVLKTTEAVPDERRLQPLALDLSHPALDARPTRNPAPCYLPADCVISAPQWTEMPARTLVGGPPTSSVVRMARGFKQEGLPLAVLWNTPRNRIAIGLNSHGTPGLWYMRRQN